VIIFTGFTVLKNNTRSNWIGTLDIGIVKTFYMSWFLIKPEIFLHLSHYPVHVPVRIYNFHLLKLLLPEISSVSNREVYNFLFVPQLWYRYFYFFSHIYFKRHIDLFRIRMKTLSYLNYSQLKQFFITFIKLFLHFYGV